jgi:CubicO group peptidase (beta-lactamase class C family)
MKNIGRIALTGKGLLLVMAVLVSAAVFSQKEKKIDQVFQDWNQAGHPGGVVIISSKGEEVYSKAFGLASLETKKPLTTETVFNIGSVSKQFTALGIALLEEAGKLSLTMIYVVT